MAAAEAAIERLSVEAAIAAERAAEDPAERARVAAVAAEVEAEEPELREMWEAMDEEERDEWLREFRRIVHEHQGELPDPASSPEAAGLHSAIARMDELQARRDRLVALQDEAQGWAYRVTANQAEVAGRLALTTARMMRHWENAPAEEWDRLDPEAREEDGGAVGALATRRWPGGGPRPVAHRGTAAFRGGGVKRTRGFPKGYPGGVEPGSVWRPGGTTSVSSAGFCKRCLPRGSVDDTEVVPPGAEPDGNPAGKETANE